MARGDLKKGGWMARGASKIPKKSEEINLANEVK
jgi:hypothetical protein